MRSDQEPAMDFDSVRRQLAQLASDAFPEWTDHTAPNFGNVLLDLFAHVADLLSFQIDCQGREAHLATATQRQNVLSHAIKLGYRPIGAAPARAHVTVSMRASHQRDVVVPAGHRFCTRGGQPVHFRVLEAALIAAGKTETEVLAEASTPHHEVFDAPGEPGFVLRLTHPDYFDGSVSITDGDGNAWMERPSLLNSGSDARHFTVTRGVGHRPVVQFGDRDTGRCPKGMLKVSYSTGNGALTNVEAGAITVAPAPLYDVDGRPVEVEVFNRDPAAGGQDMESLESIKRNSPLNVRTAGFTLNREDFEINACRVPGVARALMLTSDVDPRIEENSGRLYLVPHEGRDISESTCAEVFDMVTVQYPCPMTFRVQPEAAIFMDIDIDVTVEPTCDVTSVDTVKQAVAKALRDFFAVEVGGKPNPRINFGFYARSKKRADGDVAWSDIVTAVCLVDGVRKLTELTLNGYAKDAKLDAFHFPRLRSVNVRLGGHDG